MLFSIRKVKHFESFTPEVQKFYCIIPLIPKPRSFGYFWSLNFLYYVLKDYMTSRVLKNLSESLNDRCDFSVQTFHISMHDVIIKISNKLHIYLIIESVWCLRQFGFENANSLLVNGCLEQNRLEKCLQSGLDQIQM